MCSCEVGWIFRVGGVNRVTDSYLFAFGIRNVAKVKNANDILTFPTVQQLTPYPSPPIASHRVFRNAIPKKKKEEQTHPPLVVLG